MGSTQEGSEGAGERDIVNNNAVFQICHSLYMKV